MAPKYSRNQRRHHTQYYGNWGNGNGGYGGGGRAYGGKNQDTPWSSPNLKHSAAPAPKGGATRAGATGKDEDEAFKAGAEEAALLKAQLASSGTDPTTGLDATTGLVAATA